MPSTAVTSIKPRLRAHPLLFLALALVGCDQSEAPGAQTLATVNGTEITVHQVENALRVAKAQNPTPETRKQLLEQMIDRELATQQARQMKIDRRPEVMLRLDELERDVLASTWGESITSQIQAPSEDELLSYHKAHPELFAERRIYQLQELSWPIIDSRVADIWQRDKARPSNDVVAALRAANAAMREQTTQRAAENLPMEVVAKLHKHPGPDYVLFETPRALLAYRVLAAQSAPISYEAARPRILTFLTNARGKDAVTAAVAQLRKSATIEYAQAAQAADPPTQR